MVAADRGSGFRELFCDNQRFEAWHQAMEVLVMGFRSDDGWLFSAWTHDETPLPHAHVCHSIASLLISQTRPGWLGRLGTERSMQVEMMPFGSPERHRATAAHLEQATRSAYDWIVAALDAANTAEIGIVGVPLTLPEYRAIDSGYLRIYAGV